MAKDEKYTYTSPITCKISKRWTTRVKGIVVKVGHTQNPMEG